MGLLSALALSATLGQVLVQLPPPELLGTINLMEQLRAGLPGLKSGTSMSLTRAVLSDGDLAGRLSRAGLTECFWVIGLLRELESLEIAHAAAGPIPDIAKRSLQLARTDLEAAVRKHCGGPKGPAAGAEWRALAGGLLGLGRPRGLLHRSPVGRAILAHRLSPQKLRATGGHCDLETGGCTPVPPEMFLVAAAAIISGLIPVPDELVTWPVVLRLAGAGAGAAAEAAH